MNHEALKYFYVMVCNQIAQAINSETYHSDSGHTVATLQVFKTELDNKLWPKDASQSVVS